MKLSPVTHLWAFGATCIMLFLVSCQKDFKVNQEANLMGNEILSATASTLDHPGRTMAANCFQCHGTNGFAGNLKIASMGAAEMISKFNSYRTKAANADIMYFHAQSYDTTEVKLIADYFSKQQ